MKIVCIVMCVFIRVKLDFFPPCLSREKEIK